jgi:hypothetical protein
VLNDPATLKTNNVGKRHSHLLAARRNAHEVRFLGALHRRTHENLVTLRDHVLNRHREVGKGGTNHLEELAKPFAAACKAGEFLVLHIVLADDLINDLKPAVESVEPRIRQYSTDAGREVNSPFLAGQFVWCALQSAS